MNKKIKVLAITGIRSEYDILFPVLDTLNRDENFELKIVVSGAHLSDWHGYTIEKIEKDGFEIADRIDNLLMTNRTTQRVKAIGMLTYALSQTVERVNPDILLVVGDREESIATALVGNYMNVLVAHIGGGDTVYGNADDPIRFAVSKLAHIHFTTAQQYADNLKNIGEEEFRIFNTGNPALDNIRLTPKISLEGISKTINFSITDKNYIVLLKHPLSSEKEAAYSQMNTTLKAVEAFCNETKFKVVAIYPNTDPGSYDILKAINNYENKSFINYYKTLPRDIFVNVLRNAKALIGNSSMGILEGPYYKLPVINVGRRQMGRLNAGNVEFVDYNQNEILSALKKACYDEGYRNKVAALPNPFGDGKTAEIIKDILLTIDLKDIKWYIKKKLC